MLEKPLRWAGELRAAFAARRHTAGFLAMTTPEGVRYLPIPELIWGTKSHEFWVFLSALLHRLRPDTLLEIGSGRSTVYLSDYAGKYGKTLISIDEDPRWAALGNTICRVGGLDMRPVHHVPQVEGQSYDTERLRQVVGGVHPDFVFVDGPMGYRAAPAQNEFLVSVTESADIIIIDDVQWRHVHEQMEMLAEEAGMAARLFFSYTVQPKYDNWLAVLLSARAEPLARQVVECLDLAVHEGYAPEVFPHD